MISRQLMTELGYEAAVRREIAILRQLKHVAIARLVASFRWRCVQIVAHSCFPLYKIIALRPRCSVSCAPPWKSPIDDSIARSFSRVHSSDVYLLLEYASRGDLHSTIRRVGSLATPNARFITAEVRHIHVMRV